ncbi:very short patch repair endonuclease [Methylobacterium bullatum]
MDTRTPEQRRRIMQSVGQKDTKPEVALRQGLHRLGYRFRLHRKDLPGRPDLVFPSRKKVVFVHGCFWHGHGCAKGRLPKSRPEFWVPKIEGNKARDARAIERLTKMGWETHIVWQCDMKNSERVAEELATFLGPPGRSKEAAEG